MFSCVLGISMGKNKNSRPKQVPTKLTKSPKNDIPVQSNQVKRKRAKFKTDHINKPKKNVKNIVSNLKRPKDVVSANWQAFLASDLCKPIKSQKKKPTQLTALTSKPKFQRENNTVRLNSSVTETRGDENDPTGEAKETYISELDPKSEKQRHDLTRCIAMDCEMVGVFDGKESVLARVSLVNQHGECVYDHFVKPKEKVADYRTKVSGVRPGDLKRGKDFETVQKEVAAILKNKVLVGHALRNDLKVLMLSHPPKMIRDTSRFTPFRNVTMGRTPSLKKLTSELLGATIQTGEHSSVEDAKAAMQLYNLYQKEWEEHRLKKKGECYT